LGDEEGARMAREQDPRLLGRIFGEGEAP
jgi:hypothetical protein